MCNAEVVEFSVECVPLDPFVEIEERDADDSFVPPFRRAALNTDPTPEKSWGGDLAPMSLDLVERLVWGGPNSAGSARAMPWQWHQETAPLSVSSHQILESSRW